MEITIRALHLGEAPFSMCEIILFLYSRIDRQT